MQSPKIAVILVNYTNYDVTLECINSLLKCNKENVNIYVVENGSENESKEVLSKSELLNEVELICLETNLGFAGGNNVAIKKALSQGCEYIILLNSDTEVDTDFIVCLYKHADKENVVVPKIYYYSEKNTIWYAGGEINWKTGDTHHIGVGEKDIGQYDCKREVEFASGCCMMLHRDIVNKVGYLDESYFMYYEDTDYCARLKQNGIRITYIPEARIWHKIGKSTNGEYSKFTAYYMAKNRLKFVNRYSNQYLFLACFRTLASG